MKKNTIALFLLGTLIPTVSFGYELEPKNGGPKIEIPIDSGIEAKTINDLIFDSEHSEATVVTTKDFIFNNQLVLPKGTKFVGRAFVNNNERVSFEFQQLELSNGFEYYVSAEAKNPSGNDYVKAKHISTEKKGGGILGRAFRAAALGTVNQATDGIARDTSMAATEEATDGIADEMRHSRSSSYSKLNKNTSIKIIIVRK